LGQTLFLCAQTHLRPILLSFVTSKGEEDEDEEVEEDEEDEDEEED
jgi:hypothetical protein